MPLNTGADKIRITGVNIEIDTQSILNEIASCKHSAMRSGVELQKWTQKSLFYHLIQELIISYQHRLTGLQKRTSLPKKFALFQQVNYFYQRIAKMDLMDNAPHICFTVADKKEREDDRKKAA